MHLEVLDTGYRIVRPGAPLRDSARRRRLHLESAYLATRRGSRGRAVQELGMRGRRWTSDLREELPPRCR